MKQYLKELKEVLDTLDSGELEAISGIILDACRANRSIYVFGNGDSATNAFHFSADWAKTAAMNKKRLKIMCLNDNMPLMTAWANDESYASVFKRQLENFVEKDDVVIGISTSGNSPNVVNALEFANGQGAITIALSAFEGGKIKGVSRHCVIAKTKNVEIAEDVHFIIGHMVKYYLIEKWKGGQ